LVKDGDCFFLSWGKVKKKEGKRELVALAVCGFSTLPRPLDRARSHDVLFSFAKRRIGEMSDNERKASGLEGNPMPGTHPSALQSPFSHVKTTSL
jgi:hypothetical protein